MYVDPSRVQMAIRFARIAAGSAVEREAATDDLRVFLDALWADATAEGRARYMTAAARVPGGLPWAAVMVPDGPGPRIGDDPVLSGPAVVELIVGQADPRRRGGRGVSAQRRGFTGDQAGRGALLVGPRAHRAGGQRRRVAARGGRGAWRAPRGARRGGRRRRGSTSAEGGGRGRPRRRRRRAGSAGCRGSGRRRAAGAERGGGCDRDGPDGPQGRASDGERDRDGRGRAGGLPGRRSPARFRTATGSPGASRSSGRSATGSTAGRSARPLARLRASAAVTRGTAGGGEGMGGGGRAPSRAAAATRRRGPTRGRCRRLRMSPAST